MDNNNGKSLEDYFSKCLYFTANSLARSVTRIADKEFSKLNLSLSQGFLMMLVTEKPGISQKELGAHLNLAQSTISRFVDSLVREDILRKEQDGKLANVYPTEKCFEKIDQVHEAWEAIYAEFNRVLGQDAGDTLTAATREAYKKFDSK